MRQTVFDTELLWVVESLDPATIMKMRDIVPVSRSNVERRLRTLEGAGEVESYQTTEPYYPTGWRLTDAGRETLDAARAPPELPTAVLTVGDTRPYPLPPAEAVDFESYFAGRPDAIDHDMFLGAVARAVWHATHTPAAPVDAPSDGDSEAETEIKTATEAAPDAATDSAIDHEPDGTATAPIEPHEPSTSAPAIGLPVPPAELRTDVWVSSVAVREHVAAVPKQTGQVLRALADVGLIAPDTDGEWGPEWDQDGAVPAAESDPVSWRLTAAGRARLAQLVADGLAVVVLEDNNSDGVGQ